MVIELVSGLPNSPLFNLMDSIILAAEGSCYFRISKNSGRQVADWEWNLHADMVFFPCGLCNNLMYLIAKDSRYFER